MMHADLVGDRRTGARRRVPGPPRHARPPALPFGHLNLRRNPFGEWDLAAWAGLAVVEVDRFLPRLERPGCAVQFMGEKGRGKTTHLLAIRRRFPGAAYVHIGEGEKPRIPRGHPLLVDEIQRVPPARRRRIFRLPVSLVLGTHEDFRRELAESGFEVETVRVGGALDPARLQRILNRRVEAARRGPGRLPRVTLATARAMIERFDDDLRAIQWHMYDLFQSLPGIHDV